jgi:hypothetical protein
MAKIDTAASTPDRARARLTGTFSSTSQSASIVLAGPFNMALGGSGWVASISLERSFDGGTTWRNVTQNNGAANAFTAPLDWTVPGDASLEPDVLYRLNCTFTSGSIPYRLSQ